MSKAYKTGAEPLAVEARGGGQEPALPSLPDLPPSVPVKSDPDAVPSVAVAGAVVVAAGAVADAVPCPGPSSAVADSSGPSPPPEKRRARDHPSSSWLDDVLNY